MYLFTVILDQRNHSCQLTNTLRRQVHSVKHLVHQEIIKRRGQQLDFEFYKSIATKPETPEYSGDNTRYVRELGALNDGCIYYSH